MVFDKPTEMGTLGVSNMQCFRESAPRPEVTKSGDRGTRGPSRDTIL